MLLWRPENSFGVIHLFPSYLRQGLSLLATAHSRLAGPQTSGDSPISTTITEIIDSTIVSFYMCSGDMNSHLHACMASFLFTEPSPSLHVCLHTFLGIIISLFISISGSKARYIKPTVF